jgi:hypothetical protein
MANLLGDDATLGFRTEADHRRLRANLAQWSSEIHCFDRQEMPAPEMDRTSYTLFDDYLH